MPVSPFSRGINTDQEKPERSSSVGGKKRKRKSKPTTSTRSKKQRIKDRYAHSREDAQLAGLIPTSPEESLKPERVDPSVQGSQPLPELIAQAIRKGWAVDDGMKPHLVDELVQIVLDNEMCAKSKIAAFNALRMGDQAQWEKEHPKDVKDTTPTAINIQVVTVEPQPQPVQHNDNLIEVEVVGNDNEQ